MADSKSVNEAIVFEVERRVEMAAVVTKLSDISERLNEIKIDARNHRVFCESTRDRLESIKLTVHTYRNIVCGALMTVTLLFKWRFIVKFFSK